MILFCDDLCGIAHIYIQLSTKPIQICANFFTRISCMFFLLEYYVCMCFYFYFIRHHYNISMGYNTFPLSSYGIAGLGDCRSECNCH